MRLAPWLRLLSLVLSVPAAAQEVPAPFPSRERILVAPARPEEVPPLEVHVAGGVPTLLRFDGLPASATPELPANETRVRLIPVEDGAFILLPSADVPADEPVRLTVRSGTGTLRFTLVTRRAETDVRVRVIPASKSSEEEAAEALARHLLATAQARASLVLPQHGLEQQRRRSFVQVDSVLWMGRRFFVTLSVKNLWKSADPWRLVQVRLRTTRSDGTRWEWPARLLSGEQDSRRRQHHVATSLVPDEGAELEVAMDGENAAGVFRPLDPNPAPEGP